MTDDALITSEVSRQRDLLERLRVDREDLAQDVHLDLLRRPPTTPPSSALRRIEIRRRVGGCLRAYGAVLRNGRYLGPKGAFRTDMPSIAGWNEGQEPGSLAPTTDPWVRRAVAALPHDQRRVIHALYWQEETGDEAGQRLRRSKQWVSWTNGNALRALRVAMGVRS